MGLLDRFAFLNFRRARDSRYVEQDRAGMSGRTLAGSVITEDTALEIPAFWAADRYLRQTPAGLPWHVMRKTERGSEVQVNHPVDYLLHVRPAPEWSAFRFRETMISWAFRYGNGYAEIERDQAGRPLALHPIHPSRVTAWRDPDGDLYFEINNGSNGTAYILPEDMFHLAGFGEGVLGVSCVRYVAQSLGWARSAELFGAAFFGNGLHTSTVIQAKVGLKVDAIKRMKAELQATTRGPRRWHEPVVLDNGAELKQVSVTPEQAQFIATNEFLVDQVSRVSGVPPHKLSQLARATFSNIEHQSIEVVQDAVMPWIRRLEDEANFKLFGQNRMGLYTKINERALLRGDFKTQQEGFEVMRRNGIINADEWRELLDMNPMPAGAGGDLYVMQQQNWPLSKLGTEAGGAAEKAAADDPADDDRETDEAPDADEAEAIARLTIMAADTVDA